MVVTVAARVSRPSVVAEVDVNVGTVVETDAAMVSRPSVVVIEPAELPGAVALPIADIVSVPSVAETAPV